MSPKAGLDKGMVVEAAAHLVNSEGIEALTLRRIANQLGVRTPSLYNHIDGLPGLHRELALMSARLLSDRLRDAAIGKSGSQALMAIAQAFRDYIKTNPGLYMSSLRPSWKTDSTDNELQAAETRLVEIVLVVMASFGLEGKDGLHAVRGLRSVVHGFATLEIAGGFGLPIDCDESFSRLMNILIRGLYSSADFTNSMPLGTNK